MKKYKTIALSLLLGFSLAACSDFLEFDPYGLEGSTNFWKTEEDVEKALNAFHEFTYQEGVTGRGFMWFENCSDNMVTGRSQSEAQAIKDFQMTPENGRDQKGQLAVDVPHHCPCQRCVAQCARHVHLRECKEPRHRSGTLLPRFQLFVAGSLVWR